MTEGQAPTRRSAASVVRELIPDLFVLALAGAALVTSLGWPDRAALFPKFISILLIVLALAHIGMVVVKALRPAPATSEVKTSLLDVGLDLRGHGRDLLMLVVILAGFGVAMLGLGFVVGSGIAALIYIRFIARDSWLTALITAASLSGMIWLLITLFRLDFRIGLFM